MTTHHIDLSHLDALLEGTEPAEHKAFDAVPDGPYQVFVDKAYVNTSDKTGREQLVWELVILAGPHRKRRLFHRNTLINQNSARWLLHDLQIAGADRPTTMNDLHRLVKDLLDVVLEISIKTKPHGDGTVTNIYLNKRLDLEIPADLRGSGGSGHDLALF